MSAVVSMRDQPDADAEESTPSRTGMLERALLVLSAFGPNDVTVSPTALAKRAGLSKATGHRIIAEMIKLGFLERTVGGVRLGMLMFEIGQLVPRQRNLRRIAVPVMQDLREATKLTVHLAVLDQGDVLYVDILQFRQHHLPSRIGGRMPSYATGVGKAMLAHAPDSVVQEVLSKRFRRLGPNTIRDAPTLLRELQSVRLQGVAFEREESGRGTGCVGAAVRTADGELQGGLSLTGQVQEIDFRRVAPAVRTAALTLGRLIDRDVIAQQHSAAALLPGRGQGCEAAPRAVGAPANVTRIRDETPRR